MNEGKEPKAIEVSDADRIREQCKMCHEIATEIRTRALQLNARVRQPKDQPDKNPSGDFGAEMKDALTGLREVLQEASEALIGFIG
ncbi:MAG: hypothetical protein KKE05_00435 [Nanoarchaeota archaeon]|nr:hypothetical protein [Nanoarchaeota archaeon]